jgi:hypothetical protein
VDDLLALYKLHSIPDAFVSERLHHVAHSFGSVDGAEGFSCKPSSIVRELLRADRSDSWFHFLCKNVPVVDFKGVKYVGNRDNGLSQADFTWVRSAYCLKTKPGIKTSRYSEATLIVFGGELELWKKFDVLASSTPCQDILEDPCCLLNIVFEALYSRIDKLAWNLATVYSQEEEVSTANNFEVKFSHKIKKILRSASHPGSAADALDFVGLHMLSKHQIYLVEAIEAVTATLESVKEHHDRIFRGSMSEIPIACETRDRFRHRGTLFKSTYLRLKSLEKRTQNMINLVCYQP